MKFMPLTLVAQLLLIPPGALAHPVALDVPAPAAGLAIGADIARDAQAHDICVFSEPPRLR